MTTDSPLGDGRSAATSSAGAPREAVAAALGSVVGAAGRWAVGEFADIGASASGAFPWHTLAINVVGCLVIGLLATRVVEDVARAFLLTGVLGGFTTMSAFAVEANDLADAGRAALAAAYVVASLVAGLAAALGGLRIAERHGGSDRA